MPQFYEDKALYGDNSPLTKWRIAIDARFKELEEKFEQLNKTMIEAKELCDKRNESNLGID